MNRSFYRDWCSPVASSPALRAVMDAEPCVLTHRERQAFWLLAAGNTTAQTARCMNLSPHTIKRYRQHIEEKIPGVHRVSGISILATVLLYEAARKNAAVAAQIYIA